MLLVSPMGVAQEIWQAFLTAHPEVTKGHLSLEQVNQKMAVFIQARNHQPHPDFEGLTSQQMYPLLNDTWGSNPLICLRNDLTDSRLDQIPFFGLTEVLFQHLLTY